MKPNALDHVALWVAGRDPLAAFCCDHLGMHEIEKTDKFTLVGSDARRGKLTLFDAEGPREPGPLERVVLRVGNIGDALAKLPDELEVDHDGGVATFQASEGLGMGLVERPDTDVDYDLDHIVLKVPEPERAAAGFEALGFERRNGGVAVKDKEVLLSAGGNGGAPDKPLLNHLALLVDSAGEVQTEARARGFEIADIKDAANTLAVFIQGPDAVKVEYVEHKPGFALV